MRKREANSTSWKADVKLADGRTITDTCTAPSAAYAIHEFRSRNPGCDPEIRPKLLKEAPPKKAKAKPDTADLPLEEPAK